MKAIIFPAPTQIEVQELPEPTPGPNDIQVRALYSMVSAGTELRMLSGHADFPMSPGYCVVGEVVALGENVRSYRMGDLVTGRSCKRFIPGTDFTCGGHAAMHVFPTEGEDRAVRLPTGANALDYVITEISSISLRGVEAADPQPGETAVVVGLGLIGAFSAAWLRSRGCYVIGTDLEERRLQRAKTHWVHETVNGRDSDAEARIKSLLNGGADIVVEATGSTPGVKLASSLIRPFPRGNAYVEGSTYRGDPIRTFAHRWSRVILQATYLNEVTFNPHNQYPGEGATTLMPADRSLEDRVKAVRGIEAGLLKAADFIDHIAIADEAPEAYAALRDNKNSNFSLVFDWTK